MLKLIVTRFCANPFNCLILLWFLLTTQVIFDLDLLRIAPSSFVDQGGKSKSNNKKVVDKSPEVVGRGTLPEEFPLDDFNYDNNLIDAFLSLLDVAYILVENRIFTGGSRPDPNKK